MNWRCVTHVCVGVLSLDLGQRGVTVWAVVFTEVIGGLGVGGDQQLLDVSLWREKPQQKTDYLKFIKFMRCFNN